MKVSLADTFFFYSLTMIRPFEPQDTDAVLDIWLRGSVSAHSFIDRTYWEKQTDAMRRRYLPSARTFIHQDEATGRLTGFVSLIGNFVAALFVDPDRQSEGIGRSLLEQAGTLHESLRLNVYAENRKAVRFYLRQGFRIVRRQNDPHTGREELCMQRG